MAHTALDAGANRLARPALLGALVVVAALYYALVLWAIAPHDHPIWLGTAFNSMLLHLLQGRFDIDPAAIGPEAFVRDGVSYAYFGIFPALLRLPALPFIDLRVTDVTIPSCLLATLVMAVSYLFCVIEIARTVPPSPATRTIIAAFVAVVLFGGSQVEFLKPNVYQEAVSWAGALSGAFILVAIRGLVRNKLESTGTLALLAAIAGMCALTRISTGLGLYVACTLLMLWVYWTKVRAGAGLVRSALSPNLLVAAAILAGFATAELGVNYGRWADPFTTAPFHLSKVFQASPNRVVRHAVYGDWNLVRLPFDLMYYFLPLWAWRGADGHFLFGQFRDAFMDVVEAPPSSFFFTDPLLLAMAGFGILTVATRSRKLLGYPAMAAIAVSIGLMVPPDVILGFMAVTFRYRMEFYPLFYFAGFLGLWALLRRLPSLTGLASRRLVTYVWAGAIVSIATAHLALLLYALSGSGTPTRAEQYGWATYFFSDNLAILLSRLHGLLGA